jgi:hypothetical protein
LDELVSFRARRGSVAACESQAPEPVCGGRCGPDWCEEIFFSAADERRLYACDASPAQAPTSPIPVARAASPTTLARPCVCQAPSASAGRGGAAAGRVANSGASESTDSKAATEAAALARQLKEIAEVEAALTSWVRRRPPPPSAALARTSSDRRILGPRAAADGGGGGGCLGAVVSALWRRTLRLRDTAEA